MLKIKEEDFMNINFLKGIYKNSLMFYIKYWVFMIKC